MVDLSIVVTVTFTHLLEGNGYSIDIPHIISPSVVRGLGFCSAPWVWALAWHLWLGFDVGDFFLEKPPGKHVERNMVTDRIMETKNVQLRQAAPASDFSIIGFFPIRVQNIPEVIRTFFFP